MLTASRQADNVQRLCAAGKSVQRPMGIRRQRVVPNSNARGHWLAWQTHLKPLAAHVLRQHEVRLPAGIDLILIRQIPAPPSCTTSSPHQCRSLLARLVTRTVVPPLPVAECRTRVPSVPIQLSGCGLGSNHTPRISLREANVALDPIGLVKPGVRSRECSREAFASKRDEQPNRRAGTNS